jgi:CheY-like chemotaxis protein/nitrogen-specific signal transduction histidine kinase/HPt (histidine-containing phosphotransfer) domain-containing protein
MLERRVNAERAERRRLQRELEALSAARDEAVAASHSKSSFLANMSHEIRTPLSSIIGFAELMQDEQAAAADKIDAAKTIVRNGRHLLEVINDILDMSKVESNLLTLERLEVALPKLLGDIEALAASRANEKSLLFTIVHHLPLPPALLTDPVRLKQILLNFCSNAIKFSKAGEVRLEVSFDAAANTVRFDVIDTGIGMTEQELGRLFKPFVQADVSTTRNFGGTGLGLYISKRLAGMLGGEIRVASEPGRGSRFSLTVPVGATCRAIDLLTSGRDFVDLQRPAFQITSIEIPKLSGRVLVAEDGLDNQRLVASYLRRAGVEFDIVDNGRLAVDHALAHEYALVLMDIQMPVMDGVAATELLRRSNYRGPIVALTANVMQGDMAAYRQSGCTDVLAKPIDRRRFYAVLSRHVPGARPIEPVRADPSGDDAYAAELEQLVAEFVASLPAAVAAIDQAARTSDWQRLKSLLHGLKGTAGSYGVTALSALAEQTEVALARGNIPQVLSLCVRMVEEARAEEARCPHR